ncbi:MAG: hypothetical protein A2Z18_00230 [Armatimonadetes bacterium RBG_16_58_9]|nr:MAG: hypothetical protein A2Z18_00230 [Armatimonadetes bacterium RBG_16_58_9]
MSENTDGTGDIIIEYLLRNSGGEQWMDERGFDKIRNIRNPREVGGMLKQLAERAHSPPHF